MRCSVVCFKKNDDTHAPPGVREFPDANADLSDSDDCCYGHTVDIFSNYYLRALITVVNARFSAFRARAQEYAFERARVSVVSEVSVADGTVA